MKRPAPAVADEIDEQVKRPKIQIHLLGPYERINSVLNSLHLEKQRRSQQETHSNTDIFPKSFSWATSSDPQLPFNLFFLQTSC